MFFEQLSTFANICRSLKIVGVKNFGLVSKKCVFGAFSKYLSCAGHNRSLEPKRELYDVLSGAPKALENVLIEIFGLTIH